jgi:hypothetical protein
MGRDTYKGMGKIQESKEGMKDGTYDDHPLYFNWVTR